MERVIPEITCIDANDKLNNDDDAEHIIDRDKVLRSPPCPLHDASSHHHVNVQDKSGKSLLIHSCARGLKETVEELAKDANIDPNLDDIEGNTALIHASQAGYSQIVHLLIERFGTLEIDRVNKLGQTALIKAAIQGRANCARILLKAGADPYKRDNGRQLNALEWAEFVGRSECAQVIIEFMGPRRRTKMTLPKAQDNFKQVACLAAIPLISGETREMPASVRPRVRSAPTSPCVKIKITPPSSPLFPCQMDGFIQQQFPYRPINQGGGGGTVKKRSYSSHSRPKSSCS